MADILIVDDEPVIRALCRRLLERWGFQLKLADGCRQAFQRIAETAKFDLLITDMKLPDGSGFDIIAKFREKFPRVPVLVVTGSASEQTRETKLDAWGLTEENVLLKPFDMSEFEGKVRRLAGGQS